MRLTEIKNINDRFLGELYDLYEKAFPVTERRDKDAFVEKMLHEPRFHCMALMLETNFAGLFTYWDFTTFLYVEHFAISEKLRGNNLGGRLLSQFVQESALPIVLEVETPETFVAKRRIAFYERYGFQIVRNDYMQPPYNKGDMPVPMYLMSTSDVITDGQVSELQQAVYGV